MHSRRPTFNLKEPAMNAFKSTIARTAVVLAFIVSGCASVTPSEQSPNVFPDQYGGF